MSDKRSVGIILPTTGFKRYMLFNRFAVERADGFVQIHLGLVNKGNALVDSYSTAISEFELFAMRKNWMDYLGRQGTLLEEPPAWQPPAGGKMDVANHVMMAHHGRMAETSFYAFSYWSALEEAKRVAGLKKGPKEATEAGGMGVMAEGMALLRSPLGAQQHLIRLLFKDSETILMEE
jgi:hypothetical protein